MTAIPDQLTRASSRGYLVAMVSSVILSTTAIFIRHLTVNYAMPALVLAFWRDVMVSLTVLGVLWWQRSRALHLPRLELGYLAAYGLVLALFNALWTLSVAENGAAVATVLAYCSGGFTALLGWWLLKETLDWAKMLAVALCFAGCYLVSGAPMLWQLGQANITMNVPGVLIGILSGLGYAVYSLMGRRAAQRGLSPWTTLLYTFAFAAAFLLVFNLLPNLLLPGKLLPGIGTKPVDLFWLGTSLPGWGILLLLAAGPTVAGFGLYNVSLSLLPSSIANLILTSEPVFTALIAYLLLGERLNLLQLGGGALILTGVVFLRLYHSG